MLFFTNGTILNPINKNAFDKIGKYCKKNSDKNLSDYMKKFESNYYDANSPCSIIISDYEHDKIDYGKFQEYYNSEYTKAYIQKKHFVASGEEQIFIGGKAKDNIQYYIDKGYTRLALFDDDKNKFCIINDKNENVYHDGLTIDKGISIAANGNVFVGCSQPYKELDKENICNILQCNNNLFLKIDKWCWKYPLNTEQQFKRNNLKSIIFRYEHGIDNKDWINGESVTKESYEFIKMVLTCYEKLEETIKKIHKLYPLMNHFETQVIAMYVFAKGVPHEYREYVMQLLSLYVYEDVKDNVFSDLKCDFMIDEILKSYFKRIYGIDYDEYIALYKLYDMFSLL